MKTLKYILESKLSDAKLDNYYSMMLGVDNGEFTEDEIPQIISYFITKQHYKQVKNTKPDFNTKLQSPTDPNLFIYFKHKTDKWGNNPFWEWSK